jgi:hypothetical protein
LNGEAINRFCHRTPAARVATFRLARLPPIFPCRILPGGPWRLPANGSRPRLFIAAEGLDDSATDGNALAQAYLAARPV